MARAAGDALQLGRAEQTVFGTIAGRYEVLAELGKGGAGSVLRVRDTSSGRQLALKQLKVNASAKQVALFEREYHTLAGLRHPHIIEVHEYGTHEDCPFYTMEILEGADVTALAPMPWKEACRVMRDVASALALVHARRLIHRDISARNVWRTPDARNKLIDFGALTAFGTPGDITGTPPFVAPEALHGQALDQRTDLYSLGALGYYLLTGRNAYPAHSLSELPSVWEYGPASPSALVAELHRADLPEIPSELDLLIESLMRRDPRARPASASELIDRLNSLASLESERHVPLIEGYLSSTAFVGRERERRELRSALKRAGQGEGGCAVIEGEPGIGRSRLLSEAALDAQLAGATVLHLDARMVEGSHAVAQALAHKLLDALPKQARALAQVHARTLGHLSPELCERLELAASELESMPSAPGEARMRVQSALRDWFFAVSRENQLAVLVDDLEVVDEGSGAFLAALARQAKHGAVLVVCTLRTGDRELGAAVKALRQSSLRLKLGALHSEETLELMRSLFGETPHLTRLSERLHRVSQGNPDHLMGLAQYLVRQGVVNYRDGGWVLPQELDPEQLPATRTAALQARISRLSEGAQRLAQVLSIEEGLIPLEICSAVSGQEPAQTFAALEELAREGVLVLAAGGYRFGDDAFREALRANLDPERARLAHRTLGEAQLTSGWRSAVEQLRAGLHLMRGGEQERGARLVSSAISSDTSQQVKTMDPANLAVVAPMLEQALALFRAHGRSKYQLLTLLSTLTALGYYADRRYAERYGDEAVKTLEEMLELAFIRRAQRYLGAKLGLLAGMLLAGIRLRRARRKDAAVPPYRECIRMLLSCVGALTATATISIDTHRALAYAGVIEPFTALGKNHATTLLHEFCVGLAGTVSDRLADAHARWRRLLSRLESKEPIKGLPDEQRTLYRAGALYAYGVLETWRDDSQALKIAEQLEGFGMKLYEMSADQLRMIYYANQGNLELCERYRERVEMHAIQRGTAWQVETWAPGALITVYLRTYDARGMKHSFEQLRQLKERIPSLALYATRSRGCYLLLREKYTEALEWLGKALSEEPLAVVGWARGHGSLARAHNALGQYEQARQICKKTLAHLTDGDLSFPAINLIVELELATAEAGLGNHALANQQLAALLARHASGQGPLTLGAIHETAARVAALAGDAERSREHLAHMETWYRGTGIPSLIDRCERLTRAQREQRRQLASSARSQLSTSGQGVDVQSVAYRLRHGGISSTQAESTAQWALSQLLELSQLPEGILFMKGPDNLQELARRGVEAAPAALCAWVAQRLDEDSEFETHTTVVGENAEVSDRDTLELGGKRYRMGFLRSKVAGRSVTMGALVVPCEQSSALAFAPDVLAALAERLGAESLHASC